MAHLDRWLPEFDVREYHELAVDAAPEAAFAALLETPAGCDRTTRLLFRLRGLRYAAVPLGRVFQDLGFAVLDRTDTSLVVGAAGRPWWPSGGLEAIDDAPRGAVRIVADLRAHNEAISTETRVAAVDDEARRAFRRYWRVVGPFSALIRRRGLAAASRAIASANRSTAPSPKPR